MAASHQMEALQLVVKNCALHQISVKFLLAEGTGKWQRKHHQVISVNHMPLCCEYIDPPHTTTAARAGTFSLLVYLHFHRYSCTAIVVQTSKCQRMLTSKLWLCAQ